MFEVVQVIDDDQVGNISFLYNKVSIKADSKNRKTICFFRESNAHVFSNYSVLVTWLITDDKTKKPTFLKSEKCGSYSSSSFSFLFINSLLISCKINNDRNFDSRYISWDSCGISGKMRLKDYFQYSKYLVSIWFDSHEYELRIPLA